MVATKSKKASKYTYAERVLSAFSQAQKEHRRHSIHLATLRAHVRKIAKDRKDKLGPQWVSWVGKTVKKLAEQGVLQPVDSSGYVGMTPEGKKVISYARRKFIPATAGEPSPAQEDVVWKNVTDHFSPSGHKRQRERSVFCFRSSLGEEDVEEEDSASVRGSPRTKRQRWAQSLGKTPERSLSKMTKAELQSKVRELQRMKLIDQQLKAQLTDRERQLRNVQDELKQFKLSVQKAHNVMHEEDLTELDEHDFQDQMDEEFPVPEMDMFDVHTPRPGTPAGQGAGLTRTQSGSIIHDISMRPTPAPSSPDLDRRYRGDEDDVFADQQREHPRTPESLPDRRTFGSHEPQQNTIITDRATGSQTLKDTISRLQDENDALTKKLDSHRSQAADLERETERLRATISELESRKRELQKFLTDRDNQISQLQSTFLEHEQATVNLKDTLARKEASLNTLSRETEALLRSKNEVISRMQGMEEDIADARNENCHLTEELASFRRITESFQERMAELVRTTEERQGELAQALTVAQAEAGHGAVLAQELLVMTESTKELEKRLSEARNAATALGSKLDGALELNNQLELTVNSSQKEVEELAGKLTIAEKREADLMSKLFDANTNRHSLEEAVTSIKNESRAEQVKTQIAILGLLEKIDGLQTLRDNESQSFNGRVSTLESEMEGLQLTIQNMNEAQEDTIAGFSSCKDELEHVKSALTTEQTTCNVLRAALAEVQEQISNLRLAKMMDESTITTLRAVYEKWKRTQIDCLSELESTLASVQAA